MSEIIAVARTLGMKECGFDEFWLRDQIVANPSSLGLGDLVMVDVERTQSSGGRLDLLLKDPDDESMYEVELMLGATDESHIVRTIEYWDNERRKWPQREHYAVLVAESCSRRFFNVIQLLSQTIPLIAVQVSVVEAGGHRALHFIKVLDVYEEPDEPAPPPSEVSEADWRQTAPVTLDAATDLLEVVKPVLPEANLKFVRTYIAIRSGKSGYNYFSMLRRAPDKPVLWFRVSADTLPKAVSTLEGAGRSYVKGSRNLQVPVTREMIERYAETFRELVPLVRQLLE